jgi:hypothetical protein
LTSKDGVSPSAEGVLASKDDVLPSAEGVLTSKDDVLPSAEGVLSSKDGVLPSAEGVLSSKDGVLPSAEGVLASKDDVLPSAEGGCHLTMAPAAYEEDIWPAGEHAQASPSASHAAEECAVSSVREYFGGITWPPRLRAARAATWPRRSL